MQDIFVNLKRFDVPRKFGGVCPLDNPFLWMQTIIQECVELGLANRNDVRLTIFVPEALIESAISTLKSFNLDDNNLLTIGCQGVFRENIKAGENFGAFTTNLPAIAAKNLGCNWSIIGHSEERSDKLGIIGAYDTAIYEDDTLYAQATAVVDKLVNQEVLQALESGLNVLLCVGETAKERGEGNLTQQKPRIEKTLRTQLVKGLEGVKEHLDQREVIIGYEPVWAIGPGKTPPDKEYISFVTQLIKDIVFEEYEIPVKVVYGGGLKTENAAMLSSISTVDGGIIALTNFSGDIGFEPKGLKEIIDEYSKGGQ